VGAEVNTEERKLSIPTDYTKTEKKDKLFKTMDPDPHQTGKLDLDLDPHQSEKVEAFESHLEHWRVQSWEK